jgi:hypothetical protein
LAASAEEPVLMVVCPQRSMRFARVNNEGRHGLIGVVQLKKSAKIQGWNYCFSFFPENWTPDQVNDTGVSGNVVDVYQELCSWFDLLYDDLSQDEQEKCKPFALQVSHPLQMNFSSMLAIEITNYQISLLVGQGSFRSDAHEQEYNSNKLTWLYQSRDEMALEVRRCLELRYALGAVSQFLREIKSSRETAARESED